MGGLGLTVPIEFSNRERSVFLITLFIPFFFIGGVLDLNHRTDKATMALERSYSYWAHGPDYAAV